MDNIRSKSVIERYAALPLALCAVTNCSVFYISRMLTTGQTHHYLTLKIDTLIPVMPFFWAFMYLASFVFWAINYVMIANQSKDKCKRLFWADFIGKLICFVIYLIYPTQLDWPNVPITDYWSFVLNAIYYSDQPNNLFPSLHCLVSWYSWRLLLPCKNVSKRYKDLSFIIVILIFLAILFTKQHYFADIPSAIIVAEIGIFLSNKIFDKWPGKDAEKIDKTSTETEKIFA